jgi:formylglycine-generating enzyme required for sulfatase activity
MGSASGRPDETPVHEVEVSAFFLATAPVTNAEYDAFLRASGAGAPPWRHEPAFDAPDKPVVGVTWFDAVTYTAWLTDVYGGVWRLPTEAEWEYAARANAPGPPSAIPRGPLAGPWAVCSGAPNDLGLFDLGTIVHEWCVDWYDERYYARSPRENPRGPEHGTRRASRGGAWRHHVPWSTPSARSSLLPHLRYSDYGFRVLREA